MQTAAMRLFQFVLALAGASTIVVGVLPPVRRWAGAAVPMDINVMEVLPAFGLASGYLAIALVISALIAIQRSARNSDDLVEESLHDAWVPDRQRKAA